MNSTNVESTTVNNYMNMQNYTNMYALVIVPLITTLLAKIVDKILYVFEEIFKFLQQLCLYLYMKFKINILKIRNTTMLIQLTIVMSEYGHTYMQLCDSARPIMWYVSKIPNSVSTLKLFDGIFDRNLRKINGEFKSDMNTKVFDINDYLLLPYPITEDKQTGNSNGETVGYGGNRVVTNNKTTDIDFSKLEPIILDKYITGYVFSDHIVMSAGSPLNVISLRLCSTKSTTYVMDFINRITTEYNEYIDRGDEYVTKILTYKSEKNYSVVPMDSTQTFDTLFFSKKQSMLKRINNFNDISFYSRRGLKRKLSLLLTGKSGCGKTSFVLSLAHYLKRSIIYVSLNNIKKNSEIESIIYDNKYNDYKIPINKKIILFDEIDCTESVNLIKNVQKNTDSKEDIKEDNMLSSIGAKIEKSVFDVIKNTDKDNKFTDMDYETFTKTTTRKTINNDDFDLGIFLNYIDGVMDQDGMIIIACANNISNLDPALLRDGRFEVVEFTYMGRKEIVEMIEKYYDCKLTDEQISKIRDDKVIQNLRLKNTCVYKLRDNTNIDELIDIINSMKEVKICNNSQKKLDIDETFEL